MLPNWLLGKSKSKLQEILGGGGGGTDYTAGDGIDISNGVISFDPATTPAIDPSKVDGLNDDLAALAPKTALSNANILHNPWFTINQRGQSSYTNTDSGDSYSFDRWVISSANTAISKDSNTGIITFSATAAYAQLIQKFPSDYLEVGKTYTLSVMFSDGTIESHTFTTVNGNAQYIQWEHAPSFNALVTNQYSNQWSVYVFDQLSEATNSVSFKAIKLELGSVSTLAMDTAPNYATELLKCQRYFIRAKANSGAGALILGTGYALSATTLRAGITLPTKMRATPTMTINNNSYFKWVGCGQVQSPDTVDILFSDDMQHITLCESNATGFTANEAVALRGDIGGYIDFNAEL